MAARPLEKPPFWPLVLLALVLALQVTLVLHRAINWDEFYHYSLVEKLVAGTLTEPVQTFYTRAFTWVTALPGSGIDHIIAVRWVMLGCELITLAAVIGISRRFASREAAWLCALAYAGAGYVFQHATSFRLDGPAAALLMSAAWILLRARLSVPAIAASGLLIALAMMLTVKAVLYAPVFAGIAWLRWQEGARGRDTTLRLAGVGLAALAGFAALYWLHASGLNTSPARTTVGSAGTRMFSLGLQPYWPLHFKGALLAPVLFVLLLAFPLALHREARPVAEKVALAGLVLPVTTLFFYHNTAPYYFVFMLAPVCAGLAPLMDKAAARYSATALAIVLTAFALFVWALEAPGPLSRQRQLLAAAEAMFPDHPRYFDNYALLGTFPKANTFMSPIGVSLYRQGSYPSMVAANRIAPVPLVVAVDPLFDQAMDTREPAPDFLPEDLALLRGNYLHLWGPYWVAGYAFRRVEGPRAFTAEIPGRYRVDGGDLELDGRTLRSGDTILLTGGAHRAVPGPASETRLIWAAARPAPAAPPPSLPWFTGF